MWQALFDSTLDSAGFPGFVSRFARDEDGTKTFIRKVADLKNILCVTASKRDGGSQFNSNLVIFL